MGREAPHPESEQQVTAKQKRVQARLQQIKDQAAGLAVNPKQADPLVSAQLAEEAAGLGLELLEEVKK